MKSSKLLVITFFHQIINAIAFTDVLAFCGRLSILGQGVSILIQLCRTVKPTFHVESHHSLFLVLFKYRQFFLLVEIVVARCTVTGSSSPKEGSVVEVVMLRGRDENCRKRKCPSYNGCKEMIFADGSQTGNRLACKWKNAGGKMLQWKYTRAHAHIIPSSFYYNRHKQNYRTCIWVG